jgi:hypothetical protein
MRKFPRIDRYYPNCFVSTAEAYCRYVYGIEGFSRTYANHTIAYRNPHHPIQYASNGVELDLNFSRTPWTMESLFASVEEFYGIRVEETSHARFDDFRRILTEKLASGEPVICDFNLGHMRQRREFQKVFQRHMVCIVGNSSPGGAYLAEDQTMGSISIDAEDLENCFNYNLEAYKNFRTYRPIQAAGQGRSLNRGDFLAVAELNIKNMCERDPSLGLNGFRTFLEELKSFLKSDRFKSPFSIPGFWIFSHERHTVARYLGVLQSDLGLGQESSSVLELQSALETLFKKWFAVDMAIEKSLVTGNPADSARIIPMMEQIYPLEEGVIALWKSAQQFVGNHAERRG